MLDCSALMTNVVSRDDVAGAAGAAPVDCVLPEAVGGGPAEVGPAGGGGVEIGGGGCAGDAGGAVVVLAA